MIAKTEALVLRIHPHSNTSHIVVWLTPHHGRIATLVKGACRPRSPFLGQYDLFCTCELLYYVSASPAGLHIARECALIDGRPHLRANWRACLRASYLAGLVLHATEDGSHDEGLFRLATGGLDALDTHPADDALVFWFELQLLGAIGLAPQLDACVACGRPRAQAATPAAPATLLFSCPRGGLLCPRCGNGRAGAASAVLPRDAVALMRRWQDLPRWPAPPAAACTSEQLVAVRRVLGMFLEFHLRLAPTSRSLALDVSAAAKPPSEGAAS